MNSAPPRQHIPKPIYRKLRVFAVDPGMTARFETAVMNEVTLSIPWEVLKPGPVGEYIAVVDRDERGKQLHEPVNLDRPDILAQDGLVPSDGNPQFRQQMVYAVAMHTIRNFERALGRLAHWPPTTAKGDGRPGNRSSLRYNKQLIMHPHYMVDANAHYLLPDGLCFGYFTSNKDSPFPGMWLFTCLSQDIISHELTHALLAGMNIVFEGRNPDTLALHEGFADLIPLFQHFRKSAVLQAQITAIRGNLDERSSLGAVALQFGQALGRPDGLRNALGGTDSEGNWRPRRPNPALYQTELEPHSRGDILVGAVFDAFKKIYESRVADLRRIATKGTGILAEGNLHPDLVNRLTNEASKCAQQVLDMCIRALDYIPPVEITFGDFLRAVVTADYDLDPTDERRYRVAFVDAFRSSGIFPPEIGTLSVETLLWAGPKSPKEASFLLDFLKELALQPSYWNLPRDREVLWTTLEQWKTELTAYLKKKSARSKRLGGVDLTGGFEVLSFHPREKIRLRVGPSLQWVIKLRSAGGRAGCTMIVDADTGMIRYLIAKNNRSPKRLTKSGEHKAPAHARPSITPPVERMLRVFAFDPSLGVQLETAGINEVTLRVAWERDQHGKDLLEPGPVGEYLEIIDRDPGSGCSYAPVDLNHPYLLAQDGLPPSESNPQFHQQMVYAVTMKTVRNFELALGRLALWSPRHLQTKDEHGAVKRTEEYVQRLRIYPHALREANAYYSPTKKAVLFGYFPSAGPGDDLKRSTLTVFTALSHDIIAHEVTHALLDGMHRRFSEASNPDVLAFHEAFADLVALFQHFSFPEVLRHQITATRGDLTSQNRLGELAQQFGQAIGKRGALRDAIGSVDEATGRWQLHEPDPAAYDRELEPHSRGAILVAAVFDAFLTIYKSRIADLLRIASEGTGLLPQGQLHPDLANRLADEAAQSAQHVLEMCVQALDYCPPVDITFGDYLRAIVTADFESDPVDEGHRRVAFAEAFRRHGIIPEEVRALSVDGLLWRPTSAAPDENEDLVLDMVKSWASDIVAWNLSKSRRGLFELMRRRRAELHVYLADKMKRGSALLNGIDPGLPVEVHSVRPSVRTDWEGRAMFQWVIDLTQRIPQYLDSKPGKNNKRGKPDYYFRGGCTLLVDAETGKVRYSIKKRLDEPRRERQKHYLVEEANESLAATYFGGAASEDNEPFAMLHRF